MNMYSKITVLGIITGVAIIASASSNICYVKRTIPCMKIGEICYGTPTINGTLIKGEVSSTDQLNTITNVTSGGYYPWVQTQNHCTFKCKVLYNGALIIAPGIDGRCHDAKADNAEPCP